jgi:Putative beta-barrel porin-2, OmpL-like. bbp2
MKRTWISLFLAAVFTATPLLAADSTASTPITWSGFVDAYYNKNFNSPSTGTNSYRVFDVADNQIAFSLAELVVQKQTSQSSPVGFRMDLDYGPTNDLVQAGNAGTLNILQQGYLTAVLPIGSGLTVDVGKFVTHMGYEVIESKDNWNYSRSYLFGYAIPFFHTGVRLTYPVASVLSATVHILNGWNSVVDNNHSKTLGLTLNWTATPSTSIIFNGIDGFEQPFLAPYGKRDVADFIVTETVNDNLSLALNADYGQERVGGSTGPLEQWKGAAIYGRYSLDSKSAVALRAEVYYDPFLYTTVGAYSFVTATNTKETLKEITVTYEYHVFDPLMVRAELRDDLSNNAGFFNTASATPSLSAKSQPTFVIGVVTTF